MNSMASPSLAVQGIRRLTSSTFKLCKAFYHAEILIQAG